MSLKARKIIGWVLTALLAFVFLSSAIMKLAGSPKAAKGMAAIGLTPPIVMLLAVIEIGSILLFALPRTGLLGLLLLAAYLGGAIATHLEHGQSVMSAVVIQCLLWITAAIRFPELGSRLMGNKPALKTIV